ncbi:MAG: septal ring lytic transglycosylase RlpA family protein [Caldimonas sp.]
MPMAAESSSSNRTRALGAAVAVGVAALLGACASTPRPADTAAAASRDGPGANPPAGLARLADAEPRIEPIRIGGANKPYQVLGHDYVPIARDTAFRERGLASWYGRKFHGRPTASGEIYDMYAMTAAHPTLPIPSYARIRNPANGREVLVRINDRGPFHPGRIVDLSYAAAFKLDLLRGVAPVELERITFDEIRAGTWRREETGSPGTRLARAAAKAGGPPGAVDVAVGDVAAVGARGDEVVAKREEAARGRETVAPARESAAPAVDRLAPVASVAPAPLPSRDSMVEARTPPADAAAVEMPARGFWVQLGAFRERSGADAFQRRVVAEIDWLSPLLATFDDAALYRVQAGPYVSRADAQVASARLREALGLVPVVVEKR